MAGEITALLGPPQPLRDSDDERYAVLAASVVCTAASLGAAEAGVRAALGLDGEPREQDADEYVVVDQDTDEVLARCMYTGGQLRWFYMGRWRDKLEEHGG